MTAHDGAGAGALIAVVPAAGCSRRMGRPKQLLEVGGRPLLEHVVDTLQRADLSAVVVVTQAAIAAALDLGTRPGVQVVPNDAPGTQMIDSLRLGLAAARQRVEACSGVVVLPGDMPGVTVEDIRRCVACFAADPSRIVIAAHGGRGGHPLILPAELVPMVDSAVCTDGLRGLPAAYRERVVQVACERDGVVRDLDTPADYRRLGPT